MFPDNQSIMNAVGGMAPQVTAPQTASSSMNTTVNPGENNPGGMGGMFGTPSPLNSNPNYAQTIMDFFNSHPMAGPTPMQNNPVQQGLEGAQAHSGAGHWNSFLPNDPSSMMQNLMMVLGAA